MRPDPYARRVLSTGLFAILASVAVDEAALRTFLVQFSMGCLGYGVGQRVGARADPQRGHRPLPWVATGVAAALLVGAVATASALGASDAPWFDPRVVLIVGAMLSGATAGTVDAMLDIPAKARRLESVAMVFSNGTGIRTFAFVASVVAQQYRVGAFASYAGFTLSAGMLVIAMLAEARALRAPASSP